VISARIDAERYQIEAAGERLVTVAEAKTNGARAVADAKVESAQRVGRAIEESSEFTATGEAYQVAPEAFEFRLRGDVLEDVLGDKPLVLVDESFTIDPSGGIYFDVRRAQKQQSQP
jgi:regulator of protease activity HflC (stomatin/prohibitin superfamily)